MTTSLHGWVVAAVFAAVVLAIWYHIEKRTKKVFPVALKVKVDANGKIFLEGNPSSLEEARAAFSQLKRTGGILGYYRENPDVTPTPEVWAIIESVIKAAMEARVPIRLCRTPDYSDSVGLSVAQTLMEVQVLNDPTRKAGFDKRPKLQ